MKRKTNFDRYLEEQLKDPAFSELFIRAGEALHARVRGVFEPENKGGAMRG